MMPSIAFVGAGPTTIYTVHALVSSAARPFVLTIFEEQPRVGRGTPYRPGWNDPAMLSNIASIEIPPLDQTLVTWLHAQPRDTLISLGIDPETIDERTFYARVALGNYFADQFAAVLESAKAKGIVVVIRTRCRVIDAVSGEDGMTLTVRPRSGDSFEERFDHVVLATGHQWPANPQVRPGYFLSPWPASELSALPPCEIGIRGTSLSAIDASVALAVAHGEFVENEDGLLSYMAAPGTETFRMTMMSRKGLLPEADFFAPLPYEALAICTPEAIEQLIATSDSGLLDEAFLLFKRELASADAGYATDIGLEELSLETFCERYFADRGEVDPFVWAEENLREAERNYRNEVTVPWRYAILRMHEVMALLVPYLEDEDFRRFTRFFKPVFVDGYATVPHTSIKRLLALHRARKLEVVAVGDDYRIDTHRPEGGAVLSVGGERRAFDVFIEAMGQKPLTAKAFPFPSLLKQGIVRDASQADAAGGSRGIVIDDAFHPISDALPTDQLFCLSLPFILGRHPFIQGITSSHEMGQIVGEQLAAAIDARDNALSHQDDAAAA